MTPRKKLWLGTTDRYSRLRRIESLNLQTDYREIALLFYGDFQSVMFSKAFNGFMFNYAAPRISRTLSATGELERRVAKRVVDTTLLSSEAMIHGFDEGRGREAAQRIREMHSRYAIREEDFIATGCEGSLGLARSGRPVRLAAGDGKGTLTFFVYCTATKPAPSGPPSRCRARWRS